MENIYSPALEDQARKTAREAQKLGSDLKSEAQKLGSDVKSEVKKDFNEAVSRGKEAADEFGFDATAIADRAREYMESTRQKVGRAAERVTTYADDNTALVAVAAFGIGLLVGHLVTRES